MFGQRVICVITGASRGYGRTLAVTLAQAVAPASVFLLLSRNTAGLEETRARMLEANAGIRVEICSVDLEAADGPELSRCLTAVAPSAVTTTDGTAPFQTGLLVHNAGSIGSPDLRAAEHSDRSELLAHCGLNVASPVLLTSAYLSGLRLAAARHVIVNVSSLAAVQPLSSLSLYCAGKAARDMFFRALALEEAELRVLNWAPGPMVTDIVTQIKEASFDPEIRKAFSDPAFGIDMTVSAKQLLAVLQKDDFASGSHIDIYDVWQPEGK